MAFFRPSQFFNLSGPAAASTQLGHLFEFAGAVQTPVTELDLVRPQIIAVPSALFGTPFYNLPPIATPGAGGAPFPIGAGAGGGFNIQQLAQQQALLAQQQQIAQLLGGQLPNTAGLVGSGITGLPGAFGAQTLPTGFNGVGGLNGLNGLVPGFGGGGFTGGFPVGGFGSFPAAGLQPGFGGGFGGGFPTGGFGFGGQGFGNVAGINPQLLGFA